MSDRARAAIEREETKARLAGRIGDDGTRWGSERGSRSMIQAPSTSRHRCSCGCGGRASHVGLGDGLALMGGCEMHVRRWVRDGGAAHPTPPKETTDA